jgi:hypothetical protein
VQHPAGTFKNTTLLMLLNSSTAAGVEIIVVSANGSPFTEISTVIGATVPPVGIATLAPKEILNLARH